MPTENNKRIARNTIALYVRMLLIVVVTLYTSRIVLQILGVVDFGIYSLVSGVIVMFAFINNALSSATQRFFSFELGRPNGGNIEKIFSVSIISNYVLAFFIVLVTEVVGIWFLNNKLNIPPDRLDAAVWVFHISMVTLFIQVISTPYNALIVAYEKMSAYAYISVLEVVLRLIMAYLLFVIDIDKLIVYALLMCGISLLVRLAYVFYCNRYICHYRVSLKLWDRKIFLDIFGFSGWSMLGCFADIWTVQGVNVILNIFFGVIINTASGIAMQISSAINQFVGSFQTAFRPQIIKYYAAQDITEFTRLVFRTSRVSFFLLLLVSLPAFLCMDQLLHIWLGAVPEYSSIFSRLILIGLLFDAMSGPFWISAQAIGSIRNYQVLISLILLMNLPLAYICLWLGAPPYAVFIIKTIICISAFISRIFYIRSKVYFSIKEFYKGVMLPIILVFLIAIPIPVIFWYYTTENITNGILTIFISLLCVGTAIYFLGLKSSEREYLINVIKSQKAMKWLITKN